MLPCPTDQAVWLYLTDTEQVDEGQRRHIEACSHCQARLCQLGEVDQLLPDACRGLPGEPPQLLAGRYELLELLGRGGFGEVWLARDNRLNRLVAVKTLRPDRLRPGALEAMQAEARLLGQLTEARRDRRHIVGIYDCDEDAGRPFLVMEYVEGGSLGQRVRQFGPLCWQQAARYLADVGEALAEVHRRGLIHRDIKPDNILWDRHADEALLADFGITAHTIAAQGFISGTPGYMAPELRDGVSSPATDVFALAATLYHLLTGRSPFFDGKSDSLESSFTRASQGLASPDPSLERVPRALDEALRQGLSPDPRHRAPLEEFLSRLRGSGVQSLVASVVASTLQADDARARLDLSLEVLTGPSPQALVPVQATPVAQASYRDLEFVPPEPDGVQVADGHYVQLRFSSSSGGYLTLLNVGTSGKVTIVFPNQQAPECVIPKGGTRAITLRVRAPAGTDEAIGILTRQPEALLPEQWRLEVQRGQQEVDAYRSYRDLEFIAEQAEQAAPAEWTALAVKITHA
jgi:serine/threonine protein kinase